MKRILSGVMIVLAIGVSTISPQVKVQQNTEAQRQPAAATIGERIFGTIAVSAYHLPYDVFIDLTTVGLSSRLYLGTQYNYSPSIRAMRIITHRPFT